MKYKVGLLCAVMGWACVVSPGFANDVPFGQWLGEVKREALSRGIRPDVVSQTLDGLEFQENIIALDRKQPEKKWTFEQYRERVLTDEKIQSGRDMMRKHRSLLERVSAEFGVQPKFIVALWGMETAYGRVTGDLPIIESLATLAYDGRRAAFFREELMKALDIVNDGHVAADEMLGSWAGAMGHCQFMPSSYQRVAVDYNRDGRKDIWGDLEDVFASIANYLSESGWRGDESWGRPVEVPPGFSRDLMSREVKKDLSEWQRLGVRLPDGGSLPVAHMKASIVRPDGSDTAYMVYGNYDVVMRWNRSLYFATSVGLLADAIDG